MNNYDKTTEAYSAYFFRKIWHEDVSKRKEPVTLLELKSRTYAGILEAKGALLDERLNIIAAYEQGKKEAELNKSGKEYYNKTYKGNRLKDL
jgi:hypothetical protein